MKSFIILAALVASACCFSIPSELEIMGQWQKFKAAHAKTYESAVEENHRMKIFKENAIKVAKHNDRFDAGAVTFKVAINQFSDMHTHEVAEKYNGFRMELKPRSASVHNSSEPAVGWPWPWPWKNKVDWRNQGYVTAVKNQGDDCGSCWSFSTTGALEGQLFKKTGKLVSLSEQNLVDCARKNYGCNGGFMDTAFEYIMNNGGIDTEESYPYEGKLGRCRYTKANSAGTVTGFVDVKPTEDELADAVKKIGPVSVAIDATHWSFQAYSSGIYYEQECSSRDLDHAVLAVGYGSHGRKDYWIVKNSWGPKWGEKGYVKIARNKDNHCGIATKASYPLV